LSLDLLQMSHPSAKMKSTLNLMIWKKAGAKIENEALPPQGAEFDDDPASLTGKVSNSAGSHGIRSGPKELR